MSDKFLNYSGLTHLWDKIKTYILKNTAPLVNGTQTTSTSAWTGVAPFSSLVDGQVINYYLPYASTNTSVTLNLTLSDGTTTGALPVYFNNGTERMTTHFGRGSVITLMYRTSRVNSSGTTVTNSWYHLADRDTTDVQTLRIENGSAKAGANGIMNYALCAMDNTGKFQSFVTTSGTGTSKTVNTSAKFRNPMVILRNTANTAYANNAEVGSGYNTNITQRFDVRYSCNGYGSFTKNMPIYLECTKDSDGYLSVTANLLTQTFASGKYYVLVGHCCRDSVNYMYLMPDHPVYYYNGTNLIDENELKADKTSIPTKVSDLTNDSGFTANTGTVTSVAVKMNGASKGTVTTSGTIDLGTVITAHQDISGKVDKVTGKGLSTNDYTTTEKEKLAGIAEGATAVTVDSAWSDTSTNPLQNKVIKEGLEYLQGQLSELDQNAGQAINNLNSTKAPKASPALTGTPTAPTATAGTNTTQIATTAFVQTAVSGKQNTLATQTAYSAKGTSTKVPQITTNSLGQVTKIEEVSIQAGGVVNNGTLTIQKNGTIVQTFTANQATNATANIAVPTATSDLTNDSNFTTQSALLSSDAFKQAIVELIYPVGSLYITNLDDDNHNPNNLFPGTTWIRTCIGRALTGALDSEYTSPIPNSVNTFGALGWNGNWSAAFQNDVRSGQYVHTLTTAEMPAHTHSTYIGGTNGSGYVGVNGSAVGTKTMNTATSSAGSGSAHPIMQAYETYMIWRRDS